MKCTAIVLAVSLAVTTACGSRNPADVQVIPPNRIMDFSFLYARNCAGCHGTDGKGGAAVGLEIGVDGGQKRCEKPTAPQHLQTPHAAAIQEQFQSLIEETRRRHIREPAAKPRKRLCCSGWVRHLISAICLDKTEAASV